MLYAIVRKINESGSVEKGKSMGNAFWTYGKRSRCEILPFQNTLLQFKHFAIVQRIRLSYHSYSLSDALFSGRSNGLELCRAARRARLLFYDL